MESQDNFTHCAHKVFKSIETMESCCQKEGKLITITGDFCDKLNIAKLIPEICVGCWAFTPKSV